MSGLEEISIRSCIKLSSLILIAACSRFGYKCYPVRTIPVNLIKPKSKLSTIYEYRKAIISLVDQLKKINYNVDTDELQNEIYHFIKDSFPNNIVLVLEDITGHEIIEGNFEIKRGELFYQVIIESKTNKSESKRA